MHGANVNRLLQTVVLDRDHVFCYDKASMSQNTHEYALITGGATRIGRAIALDLARHGHAIAIHYHRSESAAHQTLAELHALGVKACGLQADFAADFDAASLFQQAQNELGHPITCLINSAAAFEKDGLSNCTAQGFEQHMRINLFAPLMLIQAFVAQCPSQGSIINLGDGTYGWSYSSKYLTYALSKCGLMELAELLALELAPAIRINSIGLGPSLAGEQDDAETFDRLAKRFPLQQVSSPQEVCETVRYLMAAHSVTGQRILLNGGLQCPRPVEL